MRSDEISLRLNLCAAQLMFTDGCDNGVHVIRHHDKFAELVTFPVKMPQTGLHDSLAIWACQDAASVASDLSFQ